MSGLGDYCIRCRMFIPGGLRHTCAHDVGTFIENEYGVHYLTPCCGALTAEEWAAGCPVTPAALLGER